METEPLDSTPATEDSAADNTTLDTDDRKLAYAERDKAKQRAREAEARALALEAEAAEVRATAQAIVQARVESMISRHVAPQQAKAAAAVLRDVTFGTDENTMRELLRDAGILRETTAGSPGIPGVNFSSKAAGEVPPTVNPEDLRREQVRALAGRLSRGEQPPLPVGRSAAPNPAAWADAVANANRGLAEQIERARSGIGPKK